MKQLLVIFISLTPLAALQTKPPAKQPVKPALNHQNAAGCGVNIYGNNNTLGNLTCSGIDGNLAKQLAAIANGTKGSTKLLKEVSAKLDVIEEELNRQNVNVENSPGSVFSINQSGGITAGQIYVDTHIAPSLTQDQISELTTNLKLFAGSKVTFSLASHKNDVQNFASQIIGAMQNATIDVQFRGFSSLVGGDYPGVYCEVGAGRMDLFRAFGSFLTAHHMIPGSLQFEKVDQPDRMDCIIASW